MLMLTENKIVRLGHICWDLMRGGLGSKTCNSVSHGTHFHTNFSINISAW
jgi:hypothetical protein